MKKISFLLFATMITTLTTRASTISFLAENDSSENNILIEAEANYLRHYIWRAAEFGSNDVSQSFLYFEYKKWSVNFGVNCNFNPKNLPSEYYTHPVVYDEQDFQLTYTDKYKKLKYELNWYTYKYFFQINSPSTSEISAKLTYPLNEHFNLISENVGDIWSYKGSFYSCSGLETTFTLFKKLEFDWNFYDGFGNRNFNNAYYSDAAKWVNYIGTNCEINIPLKHDYYIKGFLEYNLYTSQHAINFTGINHTSNFGLSIGKDITISLKHKYPSIK
jgi:hypothetical protein